MSYWQCRLRQLVCGASLAVLAALFSSDLHAQLRLELETVSIPDITIDDQDFPTLRCNLRASLNGTPIELQAEHILIVEDNLSQTPIQVDRPQGSGFQRVVWVSRLRGAQRENNNDPDNPVGRNIARIYVLFDGQIGRISGLHRRVDLAQVRVSSTNRDIQSNLPDVFFGNVAPGEDSTVSLQVRLQTAPRANGRERPILVDSVATGTPFFSYRWRGSIRDSSSRFPIQLVSPFGYVVDISFKPQSSDFVYDTLTVYYENGGTEKITLFGNSFEVPDRSTITLLEPSDDDILTPCQDVDIRWTGSVPELPVTVEFSSDGGRNWDSLASTVDTIFRWNVPPIESDQARFRVRQPLQRSDAQALTPQTVPVNKIAFRNDSEIMLSADVTGTVVEWDTRSRSARRRLSIHDTPVEQESWECLGLRYVSATEIVAGFKSLISGEDSLYFFDQSSLAPTRKIGLPNGFNADVVHVDPRGRFVVAIPNFGTEVLLYSLPDGNVQRLAFGYPVSALSLSEFEDQAGIALLNGEILLLRTPDFSVQSRLDFRHLPIVLQLALSPDARFVALGTQAPQPTFQGSGTAEVHLVDLASERIIRSFRKNSSDPISFTFSATARFLAIGFKGTPQTRVLNLPANVDEGSIVGHPSTLTDLQFAPNGFSIGSSSFSRFENIKLRNFSFPERDSSLVRVVGPRLALASPSIPPTLIGARRDVKINQALCNIGEAPLDLARLRLESGISYRLATAFERDTLAPGECIDLDIIVTPSDTGLIKDRLIFSICESEFDIALETRVLNRNIALLADGFDFGSLCVGEEKEQEVDLIRNDDDEPLTVNAILIDNIATSPFVLASIIRDTILAPGETLKALFRFAPRNLGRDQREITISHSDQSKVFAKLVFLGSGVGAELEYSHDHLPFIPEIRNRRLTIGNNSDNNVSILGLTPTLPDDYRVITPLPLVIPPQGSVEIEVEYTGTATPIPSAELIAESDPCSGDRRISVGEYHGSSIVEAGTVVGNGTEPVTIPITYTNTEVLEYKGDRIFETELMVHPRLFLPQSVTSQLGTATLIRNEIVDGQRIIGIRVEGNFPPTGLVAEIHGLPGLADVLETPIDFVPGSLFWSAVVETLPRSGLLRLEPRDPTRRLIHAQQILTLRSAFPNPATNQVMLDLHSELSDVVTFELFDVLGQAQGRRQQRSVIQGDSQHLIDVSGLPPGSYRVVVRHGQDMSSLQIVVSE